MTTGRAATRHLIECLRNCLLGDATDVLLRAVEGHARRLDERCKKNADGCLPPGWPADLPADDDWAAA